KLKLLILICYLAGVVGSIFVLRNKSRKDDRILLWLAILFFLSMTILAGNKMPRYLIWAIPFYISLLSVSAISWAGLSKKSGIAIMIILSGLFILQTGVNVRRIIKDKYRNIYIPAVEELKSLDKGSALIMGPAELAFSFGFDSKVIDDPSLGYFSGKRPDIIVVDPRYSNWFDRFRKIQPETYEHIEALLENEFDKTYQNVKFKIYVRRNRNLS
ncbi:MAG: hypothetical protein ABIC40_06690, partial [bacterium]